MMNTIEANWRKPPPGMQIVKTGRVKQGDWFYISEFGAWAPVPRVGWGELVANSLIARGTLDESSVGRVAAPPVTWLVDDIGMPDHAVITVAMDYGYGGEDAKEAALVLRRYGYKVQKVKPCAI